MSLRIRLTCLLIVFAAFAVLSATATIYGVKLQVASAVAQFEQSLDRTEEVDYLRRMLGEQILQLREIVEGKRESSSGYRLVKTAFFDTLRRSASSAEAFVAGESGKPSALREAASRLETSVDACVSLVEAGDVVRANRVLTDDIEGNLVPATDARLREAEQRLEQVRHRSVAIVTATANRVFALTVGVAMLAGGLVLVGGMLIRRWLFAPLAQLQAATERYGAGRFDFETNVARHDEMGRLGSTLNAMAQSVRTAQSRLLESETKHRLLFENLRDAVVIVDDAGRVLEYHDSDSRLLGGAGDGAFGRFFLDVWPNWRDALADWPSLIEDVVRRDRRFRAVDIELQQHTDVEERAIWADLMVYCIEFGNARRAVIVLRDVTERQRLQTRLRRAETMEAISTLAGGMAHDFNNLLTGVIGTISVVEQQEQSEGRRQRLRSALRACWQAASLSGRLLNFAGGATGDPQVFGFSEIVELIIDSLDRDLLRGIRLRTALADSVFVRMDRDQATQIILNLVRNACDAMPDGGTLDITVAAVQERNPESDACPQAYAVLTVTDSGVGMTEEVKKRVYEPFFTTKSRKKHRGRGMGMATVFTAVRSANGFIRLESQEGMGTTFEVYIPRFAGVAEPVMTPAIAPRAARGTGKVIAVDDDPMVLPVYQDILEQWGYLVSTMDSSKAVKEQLRREADRSLVVVIDLGLEDGAGLRLAEELVGEHPELALVLVSDQTHLVIPKSVEQRVRARLPKPFRPESLAAAVADAFCTVANGMETND